MRNEREERRQRRDQDLERDGQVMEDWMNKKKRQENELARRRRKNANRNEQAKAQRGDDMKMQNFGDIRREFDKKKERHRRKMAQSGGHDEDGPRRGGSNTVPTRGGRANSNARMSKSTTQRRTKRR